jgi:hypothetical protein
MGGNHVTGLNNSKTARGLGRWRGKAIFAMGADASIIQKMYVGQGKVSNKFDTFVSVNMDKLHL